MGKIRSWLLQPQRGRKGELMGGGHMPETDKRTGSVEGNGSAEEQEVPRTYRLMAYAVERKHRTPLQEPIRDRNYTLTFERFDTARRFNEFDGVIVFQGIFESFKVVHNWMDEPYFEQTCHRDELDKRRKEIELLLQQGGFVCFVLCEPFIDQDRYTDYTNSVCVRMPLISRASIEKIRE